VHSSETFPPASWIDQASEPTPHHLGPTLSCFLCGQRHRNNAKEPHLFTIIYYLSVTNNSRQIPGYLGLFRYVCYYHKVMLNIVPYPIAVHAPRHVRHRYEGSLSPPTPRTGAPHSNLQPTFETVIYLSTYNNNSVSSFPTPSLHGNPNYSLSLTSTFTHLSLYAHTSPARIMPDFLIIRYHLPLPLLLRPLRPCMMQYPRRLSVLHSCQHSSQSKLRR
jgi:hypothetical protein